MQQSSNRVRSRPTRRAAEGSGAVLSLAAVALVVGVGLVADDDAHEIGFETILEEDVNAHLELLCSPYLEGRDSPSDGLTFSGDYVAAKLAEYGFEGALGAENFKHGYRVQVQAPDVDACELVSHTEAGRESHELGVDYVPLPDAMGDGRGELVFCGYGIDVRGFDELKGLDLEGKVAVFAHGEPRHKRALDGPVLTPAANVYRKLDRLADEGAVGALVVRRSPPADVDPPEGWPEQQPMGFRYTWASWVGERPDAERDSSIPAVEISEDLARSLLGELYETTLDAIDAKGKPVRVETPTVEIELSSGTRQNQQATLHNIVGRLRGTDPQLAGEIVVIGAHLDHIGADPRGRIGTGADDNASGIAALLEVAEALAASPPRRDVIVAAFASEEDGLVGSRELVASMERGSPVALSEVVAMVNLDMVGRGSAKSVNAIGAERSKDMESFLKRARRLNKTGLSKVVTGEGLELWQRSDHYSFYAAGVPAVFLFEETPISNNKDYHTWRDTLDLVDPLKISRAARLAFNLVWLLGTEDELPEHPEADNR